LNPAVQDIVGRGEAFYLRNGGDPVFASQMTLQSIAHMRDRQASSLACFDVFFVSAVLAVGLVLLVLLMRRAVAERGAHIAAE
jgi:DHA2 family multidrug resistance protein